MKRFHKIFCGLCFCLTLLCCLSTNVLAECSVLVKFISKEDKTLHAFFPNRKLDYQLKENFLLGHIPEEKLNEKGTALKESWKFCPEGVQKKQHKLARDLEAQEDNGQKYLLPKDTFFTMPADYCVTIPKETAVVKIADETPPNYKLGKGITGQNRISRECQSFSKRASRKPSGKNSQVKRAWDHPYC